MDGNGHSLFALALMAVHPDSWPAWMRQVVAGASVEIGELKRLVDQQDRDMDKENQVLREWLKSLRDRVIELEAYARAGGFQPIRKIDPIDGGQK